MRSKIFLGWRSYLLGGKNRWITYGFIFIILAIAISALVRHTTISSGAYRRANEFIHQNGCVNDVLGTVHQVRLGFLSTFRVNKSEGTFTLSVIGSRATGAVRIVLSNGRRDWRVDKAVVKVGGKAIECQ